MQEMVYWQVENYKLALEQQEMKNLNPSEFAAIMFTIVQNVDEYEDPDEYHKTLVEIMSNAIKSIAEWP